MPRPLIGITRSIGNGWITTQLNRLAVTRAGGRPHILDARSAAGLHGLDGLVVGGGDDISLELYGRGGTLATRTDPDRDRMELDLVRAGGARDMPILGICRGAQMLNVARGGTLHVDVHESFAEAPRIKTILPRKAVRLAPGSRVRALLGEDEIRVNALHHQAVDRLGKGLSIVGRDAFGIVQAIEDAGARFMIGVQWHPEWLFFAGNQQRLFSALVRKAS